MNPKEPWRGSTAATTQSSWSVSAHRNPQHEAVDTAPDSAFIAARDAGASLRDAPAEYTVVRKLSPRV